MGREQGMAKAGGPFKIETENAADKQATVLKIHGDVDAHTTKTLQAAIGELFSGQKKYRLIVDFSHVGYMSSSGASLLIVVQQEAQTAGGKVILAGMKAPVRQVFDLLGLTPLFTIVADKKAALAAM